MEADYEYSLDAEPNHLKGFTKKKIIVKEAKEDINKDIVVIKDLIKSKKIIMGAETVIKKAKQGNISTVYLSKTVSEHNKVKIEYYKKISDFKIIELSFSSSEISEKLEKPFNISMMGVLK